MFDVYELVDSFLNSHEGARYDSLAENLRQYAAWLSLMGLGADDLEGSRQAFLDALLPGPEDFLSRLFKLPDGVDKEGLIRLICADQALWEKIKHHRPICFFLSPERSQEALQDRQLLGQKMNLTIPERLPLKVVDNRVSSESARMFYFESQGIFISIGRDVSLLPKDDMNPEELLAVFKALGDQSRLSMVKSLMADPQTASQLAKAAGISLSTVNHHIKQLIAARLVVLELGSEEGKGASFVLNRTFIRALIQDMEATLA